MATRATTEAVESLDADTILDLLANRRRRYLLYALRGYDEPVALSKVAERIAGWEHDSPPDEVDQKQYKSVYVSTVQCHVPKLADTGVVEHDSDNHTVVLANNFDQLEEYLRLVMRDEPSDSRLHRALDENGDDSLIRQIRQNVGWLKS